MECPFVLRICMDASPDRSEPSVLALGRSAGGVAPAALAHGTEVCCSPASIEKPKKQAAELLLIALNNR